MKEKKEQKIKSTNVIPMWADKYPEVTRWLAKLQDKTCNAFGLYRFCRWCGKTPTQLLALKNNPTSKEAEYLLDDFVAKDITIDEIPFSNSIKFHCVTAFKSFFKHNYRDLARASGAITLEKVKPYNKPRKEDLRKLWNWTLNPRDKALITFVNSTAIAKETLSKLRWNHLEENWEKTELPCINVPPELLKGKGRGRYKDVWQITFLTPEAKRDLLNYRDWIEKKINRKLTLEDHVFLEVQKPFKPMMYSRFGRLIWGLSKEAGISFSWHDARRYVNTAMEEIRMPPNWARKIRGRKVRGEEAPYSQPAVDQLRTKFKEAVPLLEFTSEKTEISKTEKRVQDIMDRLRFEGLPEEQLAQIELIVRKSNKQQIEKYDTREGLQNLTAMTRPKKPEKTNEDDCQKIIEESELETYIQNRWRFVATLPSGKIIVSNE